MELIWQEPPQSRVIVRRAAPVQQVREDWAMVAAVLTANPGRTAVVKTYPVTQPQAARDLSASIRQGRNSAFRPAGAFESSTATEPGDRDDPGSALVVNVYACFVPGAQEE